MTEARIGSSNQRIVLEDRSNLLVSGVEQVDSFNENTIILTITAISRNDVPQRG